MRRSLLFLTALLPWPLMAQFQIFIVSSSGELPVGESYIVGTVEVGDQLDTKFRLKNTSQAPAQVEAINLGVAGPWFSFATTLPKLPANLLSGQAIDFVVRFIPDTAASYSAYLNINGVRYTVLLGYVLPAPAVMFQQGSTPVTLATGQIVDFGSTPVGTQVARQFSLINPTTQTMVIDVLLVEGDAFIGPTGVTLPVSLQPQQSVLFQILFKPMAAGTAQGSLVVGQRRFLLSGKAQDPSFPKPVILITPQNLRAGQQASVSIHLEGLPITAGSGELRIEFRPDVPSQSNDPALMFLSTASRSVTFTVSPGDSEVHFGNRTQTEFQTGSTAGTIVFTATLGQYSEQASVTIPVSPVVLDSIRALRAAQSVEVQLNGFDTARSVSRISFTFYDLQGFVVPPGTITVDASSAFTSYFQSSQFGGMFGLRAVFPVTGNVLRIGAVEIEMTNSAGSTKSPRTAFP